MTGNKRKNQEREGNNERNHKMKQGKKHKQQIQEWRRENKVNKDRKKICKQR